MKSTSINVLPAGARLLILGGFIAAVGAFAGCGSDEDGGETNGAQGSACSSNSECGDGLICVPTQTQSLEQKDLVGCGQCISGCNDDACVEECLSSEVCTEVDCEEECFGNADCIAECERVLAGQGGGGGSSIPWEDATPGMCNDSCDVFANDGECDDGRPGSDTNFCDPGTDCTDCGAVPGGETPEPDPPTCAEWCADFPAEQQAGCIAACDGTGIGGNDAPSSCAEFCAGFPAELQADCEATCSSNDDIVTDQPSNDGGGGGSTATGTCQPDPNASGGGGGGGEADAGGGEDTGGPTCDDSDVEGDSCAEAEDCNVECDCGVTAGSCSAGVCDSAAPTCESACADMAEMGAPAFGGSWCR